MQLTREAVWHDLVQLLMDTREDMDRYIVITNTTGIFSDLGFESIDVIGLASSVEAHFGQTLPFPEFMAAAKQQNLSDITVGHLMNFLMENLERSPERRSA